MSPNRYSVILGNLGNTCDRFLSSGYKEALPKQEMLRQAAAIPDIEGVELVGNWDITEENSPQVRQWLKECRLECVSIIPDLFSQKRWGNGSLSSRDPEIRRQALDEIRAVRDADLIVESIHIVEYLELMFRLRKIAYRGWCSMDQYPYREDGAGAVDESVSFHKSVERLLTSEQMADMEELVSNGAATASTRWMREVLFARK